MPIHLSVVLGYLVVMVAIGFYYAKREIENTEDFMVAGRRLPVCCILPADR